jgi:hypothetical protein
MAIKIGKLFSANTLVGTSGDDTLIGGLFDDVFIGGAGADVLRGGSGFDTVDYSASSAGVHVDLKAGIGWGGDAQGDTLNSIEKVIGSAFADTLIAADWGGNVFTGGAGNDRFVLTYGNNTITDFSGLVVADFQGLVFGQAVPNGYKGMNWSNIYSYEPFSGSYMNLKNFGGDFVAFTPLGGGRTAALSSPPNDFDAVSLWISGGLNSQLNVRIEARDDGVTVGSVDITSSIGVFVKFGQTIATGADGTPIFNGRFTSIDELVFTSLNGNNLSFDDITYTADKIEVASGTDIAALVASAASDGQGGTLLTYPNGSIHLVGVDPASASADWFSVAAPAAASGRGV